jgi:hypothetical protein
MWTHGSFYWNELMTRDVERAKAFYGKTLGWTFDGMPMPESSDFKGNPAATATYWIAMAGGKPVGGMFLMQGADFDNIPDHWFAHIAVDDVDARVRGVPAAGGEVVRPPFDVPGVGRIAIVKDATGAMVGWITPAPAASDECR